eukprot:1302511-Amphidinium_carterae.2
MFLDPAGKAYALADSGASNVTLNVKHLPTFGSWATSTIPSPARKTSTTFVSLSIETPQPRRSLQLEKQSNMKDIHANRTWLHDSSQSGGVPESGPQTLQ